MYNDVGSTFFTFFDHIISFITSTPVIYIFYTLIFIWIISLFFRIIRG